MIPFSTIRNRHAFSRNVFSHFWFLGFIQMYKIMDTYMTWKWKQNCVGPMRLSGTGEGLGKAYVDMLKIHVHKKPITKHNEYIPTRKTGAHHILRQHWVLIPCSSIPEGQVLISWSCEDDSLRLPIKHFTKCPLYMAHTHNYDISTKLMLRRLCLLFNLYLVSKPVLILGY